MKKIKERLAKWADSYDFDELNYFEKKLINIYHLMCWAYEEGRSDCLTELEEMKELSGGPVCEIHPNGAAISGGDWIDCYECMEDWYDV